MTKLVLVSLTQLTKIMYNICKVRIRTSTNKKKIKISSSSMKALAPSW